ncbi:Hypothetical protein PMT_2730 [Prochlorococcus marinus str. MIT 9313]|uniref:Uncharacterized protein n=1 Tax=Prochlorococcus marinus (strain MIT 9313) TaxID=74547 RepID=B9ESB1_PROMM|nr:Hypothetical protein PMT_2730 [Prochlorococcus marinus str. MIT 9313]
MSNSARIRARFAALGWASGRLFCAWDRPDDPTTITAAARGAAALKREENISSSACCFLNPSKVYQCLFRGVIGCA